MHSSQPFSKGMPVTVALRPEKIQLMSARMANRASGTIVEIAYLGGVSIYHVQLPSGKRVKFTQSNSQPLVEQPLTQQVSLGWNVENAAARHGDSATAFFSGPPDRTVVAIPWLWLAIFCILPFLFALKISLSEPQLAQPPYLDEMDDGLVTIKINFYSYLLLLEDALPGCVDEFTIKIVRSTLLCVLIGYPMAYAIAKAPR